MLFFESPGCHGGGSDSDSGGEKGAFIPRDCVFVDVNAKSLRRSSILAPSTPLFRISSRNKWFIVSPYPLIIWFQHPQQSVVVGDAINANQAAETGTFTLQTYYDSYNTNDPSSSTPVSASFSTGTIGEDKSEWEGKKNVIRKVNLEPIRSRIILEWEHLNRSGIAGQGITIFNEKNLLILRYLQKFSWYYDIYDYDIYDKFP